MVTALNYFCPFVLFSSSETSEMPPRRLQLLLLLPDKFRMLIPSFQLFRAAAEKDRDRPRSLVLIQPATLSFRLRKRDKGEGGIFPPTLIQLSPLARVDGEGK